MACINPNGGQMLNDEPNCCRDLSDPFDGMPPLLLEKTMQTAWIPEAPEHPGLYANDSGGTGIKSPGKIQSPELQPSTMSPHHAKQFDTRDECQRWCDENPVPKFAPTEHGFE